MVTEMIKAKPTPVAAPPRFPRQGEWTYEDWLKFPDDGWKYEIIAGVLYMTPPPAIAHQDSSGELFMAMRLHAKNNDLGKVLATPCGVRLPGQPVPLEPDIFFVKKERLAIISGQYVEGVPDLIVEILSPSSVHYDRDKKFKLYQATGVPELWLVDYEAKKVEVYSLVEGRYLLAGTHTGDDVAASSQLANFKIAIAAIFNF
jgi:Uma2 family endonuclease